MIKNVKKYLTNVLCFLIIVATTIWLSSLKAFCHTNLSLTVPSAILIDEVTGSALYQKEPNAQRSCASITKIMTVLLVMEALESKKVKLTDSVVVSEHASSIGGSDIWLKENEKMTIDNLLKATIVASANDAAVALAEHLYGSEEEFVKRMNLKAKELGMNNTVFKNCNGLDEDGHVTTAKDVSLMARELIKYKDIFKYTSIWMDYLRDGKTQIVNTNKLLKSFEGITGLKTGTTDDAGCCMCATAKRGDISLIAVILGAETSKDRFKDAAALLNYGFKNFTAVTPKVDKAKLVPIKVKKGINSNLNICVADVKKILIPKGKESEITSELEIMNKIVAPIEKDQCVGKLIYKLNKDPIAEFTVVANENIEKANFKNIFKKIFSEIFRC